VVVCCCIEWKSAQFGQKLTQNHRSGGIARPSRTQFLQAQVTF
jgi:hypothetical protein